MAEAEPSANVSPEEKDTSLDDDLNGLDDLDTTDVDPPIDSESAPKKEQTPREESKEVVESPEANITPANDAISSPKKEKTPREKAQEELKSPKGKNTTANDSTTHKDAKSKPKKETTPREKAQEALKSPKTKPTPRNEPSPRKKDIAPPKAIEKSSSAKKSALTESKMQSKKDLKRKGKAAFFDRNYETSISWYSQAIELDPKDPNLRGLRSAAYAKIDKCEEALSDADTMITLRPTDFRGHLLRANCLFYLGNFDQAIASYSETIKCNPEPSIIGQVNSTLEKVREYSKRMGRERDVISRDGRGVLVRRKVHMDKYDKTKSQTLSKEFEREEAATKIQANWRGHVTRKWLKEVEKDADKQLEKQQKEQENNPDAQPVDQKPKEDGPLADFWEQVVEPENTISPDDKIDTARSSKSEIRARIEVIEQISQQTPEIAESDEEEGEPKEQKKTAKKTTPAKSPAQKKVAESAQKKKETTKTPVKSSPVADKKKFTPSPKPAKKTETKTTEKKTKSKSTTSGPNAKNSTSVSPAGKSSTGGKLGNSPSAGKSTLNSSVKSSGSQNGKPKKEKKKKSDSDDEFSDSDDDNSDEDDSKKRPTTSMSFRKYPTKPATPKFTPTNTTLRRLAEMAKIYRTTVKVPSDIDKKEFPENLPPFQFK